MILSAKKERTKIVFQLEKTVRFQQEHLKQVKRRLDKLNPFDITFDNILVNYRKIVYLNSYFDMGYKIVFYYKGKDYLLMYNKTTEDGV